MKSKTAYIVLMLTALYLVSCVKGEIEEPESVYSRTVLVYMAADNNLNSYSEKNITQMMEGLPMRANLVIYVDGQNTPPQIIHITRARIDQVVRQTVKTYPEHNSASPEVFASVIEDMRQMFPSESYGLVLWSHGTGWLPSATFSRAFGQDGTSWLEIDQLAAALPDNGFDFILFDACYMASIEVAYELRHKTSYIIASAAEILSEGFPYKAVIYHLFMEGEDALKNICAAYINHYNSMQGSSRSATVSLVDTRNLDALADMIRYRMPKRASEVQYFDRNPVNYMFDLAQTYGLSKFELEQQVLFSAATPYMLQGGYGGFAVNAHCGLTTYIEGQNSLLDAAIRNTQWYKSIQ